MAYEADTTQDILKRCFNPSLSTIQVTLKGGAAISLGAVRILGTASAIMQGTTTYGLEVDVQRLPNNVSPNISSIQDDISIMQPDISQIQVAISTIQQDISVAQNDISVMQDDVSSMQNLLSVIRVDTSQIQVAVSNIEPNISTMQEDISVMQNQTSQIKTYASTIASAIVNENISRVRIADTWTSGVHGVRSAISTAAIRIAHGASSTALKRGLFCRAHKNNTTTVYVGFTTLSGETTASTCGQPLLANQSFLIEANNSYSLYAIANATAQKIHYFGI